MLKKSFRGRRNKNNWVVAIIGILVCFISLGYATISTSLNVNGSATVVKAIWNVHFTNIHVIGGSAEATTSATISNNTTVNFDVTLSQPNEYYKFLVDVENTGTMDAMVKAINLPSLSGNLEFSATYRDGTPINITDALKVNETKTILITLKYKDSAASSTTRQNVAFTLQYGQADSLAQEPSFDGYTVDDLIKLSNGETTATYNDGITSEMYAFAHPTTSQLAANVDYRYIGKEPNNYITFNNETWRIIGIFKTDNGSGVMQNRLKIIREASIGKLEWSSDMKNKWSNASLQKLLNSGDYYNKANTYASNGLNATAKSQIVAAKYYLGGYNDVQGLDGAGWYSKERGSVGQNGSTTGLTWSGKVALIYPSDYIYTFAKDVNSTCYSEINDCNTSRGKSSWLYKDDYDNQYTITPVTDCSDMVFTLYYDSNLNYSSADNYQAVQPVVYLKADIKLSGAGTNIDPYVIQ